MFDYVGRKLYRIHGIGSAQLGKLALTKLVYIKMKGLLEWAGLNFIERNKKNTFLGFYLK